MVIARLCNLSVCTDRHDAHVRLCAQQRDGATWAVRDGDGGASDARGDVGGLIADDSGEQRALGAAEADLGM